MDWLLLLLEPELDDDTWFMGLDVVHDVTESAGDIPDGVSGDGPGDDSEDIGVVTRLEKLCFGSDDVKGWAGTCSEV